MQTVWKHSNNRIHSRPSLDRKQVEEACSTTHKYVYNLKAAETMRIELLSLSPTTHFLILGYHHINMDGIALEILVAEIEKAYDGTPLTSDMIQYADFSIRERQDYRSGLWSSELEFWHSEFSTPLSPLPLLPLAKRSTRPAAPNYGTLNAERNINVDLALLARYTGTTDFCIGLGDANRKDPDVRESLGLYLNLIPLRVKCETDKLFSQTLKEVQQKSQEVFAHSRVPFDVILNELNVPRSSAYAPLFQAFMNYRQGIRQMRSFCGCDCEGELVGGGQVAYDISVDITENPGGEALVSLSVQQGLYDQSHAETLLDSYFNFLDAFAANPASRLKRPALHSQVDVDRALQLGPGLSYQYTWPPTILHRIDNMVKAYPTRVALTDGQGLSGPTRIWHSVSTAKQFTGIVAVFQTPTPAFVCSILAILRTGLTYVPLDPRAGIPRLASIITKCRPVGIVVDRATRGELVALGFDGIAVDVSAVSPTSPKAIPIIAQPDTTAAVIYTSGSTGVPKGICLSHSSLRNNLEVATQKFDYREGREVTLGQCAFSFDMSLAQTFTTLCNGGTLVVVPKKLRGDSLAEANLIATEKVTWTQATPSEYISWIQHGHEALKNSRWRFACAGGEQPNYAIYILDQALNPLPVNVPGEVFIAGAGLDPDYLDKRTLTDESFLHNPYASPWFQSQGWLAMHRTGDQGRLTAEGKLVLEGRIEGDTQIKLRGIRIDLRDVEAAVIQAAAGQVTDAAVSARETAGNVFLVAHVVLNRPEDAASLHELQARLPLPQYMKPSSMIPIARLPINDSNKLDRKALAALVIPEPSRAPPVSESLTVAQAEMKALWAQVIPEELLRNFDVGLHSDFFHVGGTSLLLVNLQGLLKQRTADAPALHRLFDASTLESMASFLQDVTVRNPIQHINWEQEADLLPHDVYPQMESSRTTRAEERTQEPSRIILTGATGFLGKQLLARLLQLPSVRTVYCITVRQDLGSLPSIFQDPRVDTRAGDLAAPTLGLGSDQTEATFSNADVIIHNGADVSFMKTYPSLKRTNVTPTKYLARLAVSHRVPFSFHQLRKCSTADWARHDWRSQCLAIGARARS
ncbi:MAG: hypothetical protein Q9184_006913 [Pyrenodesmia sp. 2 TL-2023]